MTVQKQANLIYKVMTKGSGSGKICEELTEEQLIFWGKYKLDTLHRRIALYHKDLENKYSLSISPVYFIEEIITKGHTELYVEGISIPILLIDRHNNLSGFPDFIIADVFMDWLAEAKIVYEQYIKFPTLIEVNSPLNKAKRSKLRAGKRANTKLVNRLLHGYR